MTRVDVLVVADDRDFVQLVDDALAQDSSRAPPVVRVKGGGEAMALLDEGFVPHLVLLDLELPRALDVLRRLRADSRYQYTAVVVAGSGVGNMGPRRTWLPGEVWHPKPLGVDDLAMAISLALSRLVDVFAEDVAHAA